MAQAGKPNVGYDDTPFIPNSEWRVHDGRRPQPRVVTPGTESSPAAAGSPPSDAVVLFDGTDLSQWVGRDGPAQWKVENGYVEVNKTGDIETVEHFGHCQLHVEWATPSEVEGDSQGRGNSGIFLLNLYEIQVLDSYDNPTYADGGAGAIYGQWPPLVNASRKPGEWQTYDIFFVPAQFDGEKLQSPSYATVVHNGVLVQHYQEILGPTGHGGAPSYDVPHPPEGPIKLQDHGNPMRFRNIWVRRLESRD